MGESKWLQRLPQTATRQCQQQSISERVGFTEVNRIICYVMKIDEKNSLKLREKGKFTTPKGSQLSIEDKHPNL